MYIILNVLFIEVLWPYLFDYVLDKSFDLKYVIQQMLDPDPGSRPTVDQVLAFPYVRKVSAIHWEGLYKFNRDWLCTVKIEKWENHYISLFSFCLAHCHV